MFLRLTQQINGVQDPQPIVPFILTGTGKYLSQAEERLEKWRDQIRQEEEAKEQAAKKS